MINHPNKRNKFNTPKYLRLEIVQLECEISDLTGIILDQNKQMKELCTALQNLTNLVFIKDTIKTTNFN